MSLKKILFGTALYASVLTAATCCGGVQEKTSTPEIKPTLDTPEGRELLKGKYRVYLGELEFSTTYEVKKDSCTLENHLLEKQTPIILVSYIDEGCDNTVDYFSMQYLKDGKPFGNPMKQDRKSYEGMMKGEGDEGIKIYDDQGNLKMVISIKMYDDMLKEAQKSVKPENKIN